MLPLSTSTACPGTAFRYNAHALAPPPLHARQTSESEVGSLPQQPGNKAAPSTSPVRYTSHMGYKTYTCAIAKKCGGCELLAVPYELQLKRKQAAMEELFAQVTAQDGVRVEPVRGMDDPRAYRHKAATPFSPGSRATGGRMRCGFYERGTHRLVYCKQCLTEAPGLRSVLNDVAHVADDLHIRAYNEDSGRGVLRHAVVRAAYATGDILLTLVTNGPNLPHAEPLVRRLVKRNPHIVSVVQNINDRRTNAILGTRSNTLFGNGILHDKLLGCTFEIGPTSFYQTNPAQTETLYQLAMEGIHDAHTLLDAYCGTGTIGICAAAQARRDGRSLQVKGVEQVSNAVGCARRNARANGLANSCSFTCADATEWMGTQRQSAIDAVILDPPRAGSTPEFLRGVARLAPKYVSYVSCNPSTQVRDLAVLREAGYRVSRIVPVDMFPHTKHVETVVLLTR